MISLESSAVMQPKLHTHFTQLENFGHSLKASSYQIRIEKTEDISEDVHRQVLAIAGECTTLFVPIRI